MKAESIVHRVSGQLHNITFRRSAGGRNYAIATYQPLAPLSAPQLILFSSRMLDGPLNRSFPTGLRTHLVPDQTFDLEASVQKMPDGRAIFCVLGLAHGAATTALIKAEQSQRRNARRRQRYATRKDLGQVHSPGSATRATRSASNHHQ